MYTNNGTDDLTFKSFDLVKSGNWGEKNYPCRYAKCDQFCRSADHFKLGKGFTVELINHKDSKPFTTFRIYKLFGQL